VLDPAWYLLCHADTAAGIDPFGRYSAYGWAESRLPNRSFNAAWHHLDNPDVAAAGISPLMP